MQLQANEILTPVARLLMGSLYKPQTVDAEGKPLVIKQGANAGQPKVQFFFAVGIPKGAEKHWAQTEWGAKIWAVGHQAFPNHASSPHFAWKVVDGDSDVPNRTGKKPCDQEGHKGHWVVRFSSGFAPKVYNKDGTQQIVEPDAVKLGYFVQVFASVSGNGSSQQPGVFINHSMVSLSAYGQEISVGADASGIGFGQAPLPAGAMATPVGGFNPAVPAAQVHPQSVAAMEGAVTPGRGLPMPPVAMPPAPAAAMPSPNPAFLNVGAPPQAPVAPPLPPQVPVAPPAAPVHAMTAKAQGATYESFVAQGWTDALLVQHGYMVS